MKKEICPVCGEGHLRTETEIVEFEYRSVKKALATRYSICDVCGSEIASSSDSKFNKRTVTAFHKTVDGLLTGDEIKSIRERLGITQQEASVIFGGGPNSFTKYENNDVIQSVAMDNLIRLSIESADAFDIISQKWGIRKPSPKVLSDVSVSKPVDISSEITTGEKYGWVSLSHKKQNKQLLSLSYEYH
ncbi:TPA: type II toxin-antitoxin system MqsA family antitoxin [Morganella morganii]|uniref:type II toxin-antitoxin system MqsA family antitoxin n=1 Tax=Morganella morganii TaxID=582 RepID=UPI000F59D17F|nr:type II toxin-antitoxin system MqsA family antitoxin [Morganella morganii]HBU8232616.1 type II toxin-antitoxin system MqsA family antitoxin [Morganella morganii]